MRRLRLVGPRVLVKRVADTDTLPSGLVLPSVARERPQIGRVVAVGSYRSGRPLDVGVGDYVMFPKFHDRTVIIDEDELLDLSWDEITLHISGLSLE